MVTVEPGLVIPLNDDDEGSNPLGFRRALAVLVRQSSPGVPTPGRLGAESFAVTGHATQMKYNVSGGGIVLVRSTTNGAYIVGMPTAVELTTPPADAINPRIDRIWCKQPDPALDGTAVDVDFIIDVASGTPAASPLLPSIPTGSFELARKRIGASATNTSAGEPFTDVAAVTGLNIGGLIGVAQGGTGGNTKATARASLGFLGGPGVPPNSLGEDGDIYYQEL